MGPVHIKVWYQLDKKNKNSKVKKIAYFFLKQLHQSNENHPKSSKKYQSFTITNASTEGH